MYCSFQEPNPDSTLSSNYAWIKSNFNVTKPLTLLRLNNLILIYICVLVHLKSSLFKFFFFYLLFLLLLLIIILLLLLMERYNLCKVLACSTTFFQLSLFCATFFQLHMFMVFISSKTSSSQRVLGLPIGLLDGFPSLNLLHKIILSHAFNMA